MGMIKMYPNPVNPKIKKILIQTIYDIVKAHGGEIKVETKPAYAGSDEENVGTEFIIQLPVV